MEAACLLTRKDAAEKNGGEAEKDTDRREKMGS
jgi:hypothetical protein